MPVQHIALFCFKSGTAGDFIRQMTDELRSLAQSIPGITGFSVGENNSPEGLAEQLTHGFVMTFKDRAARDAYLAHPEHQKFITFALPQIQRVVVFDYDG